MKVEKWSRSWYRPYRGVGTVDVAIVIKRAIATTQWPVRSPRRPRHGCSPLGRPNDGESGHSPVTARQDSACGGNLKLFSYPLLMSPSPIDPCINNTVRLVFYMVGY